MRNALLLLLCLGFLVTCLAGTAPAKSQTSPSVVIGVPLPLSGSLKAFGEMMQNAFTMAAEKINREGGIKGRRLVLRFADDRGDVAAVEATFHQLRADGSVMLVGGYASDPTYRMGRMAEKENLPFLVCTASADRITRRGWKNVYRLNPPISEYTKGLEDFWIKNFKPQSMAILYEDSMFGTTGALRMIEFCRDQAIEVRAHIGYDRSTITPSFLRSRLAPLTLDPPDVIYMVSYLEDAVMLVRQIRALRIGSLLCGGGGGFTLDAFVKSAGENANYLLTAALWSRHVPYPGAAEFNSDYARRFGQAPDYHGAEAYSALIVAAEALRKAISLDPDAIRRALDETYLKTPFGPVRFYAYEGFERQNSVTTLLLQIIDGKFETIWPAGLASARFVRPDVD